MSDLIADVNFNIKHSITRSEIGLTEKEAKKKLSKISKQLSEIQDTIYAHGKYGVLICIQGMDTAGKDSLIREIFKELNARGVIVHSFKVPTELEKKHDYLWRHYIALPPKGKFGIFNRTHYENVLVTKVHPQYILSENLPNVNSVSDIDDAFWEKRYQQIVNFEKHISNNGLIIFKFFLNLSKKEQKNRLLRRIEKKEKNWKFSPNDIKERELWDEYQKCYETAIKKTTKPYAPWYIIPADSKPIARYLVAKTILERLQTYEDIKVPELDPKIKKELTFYLNNLENEK